MNKTVSLVVFALTLGLFATAQQQQPQNPQNPQNPAEAPAPYLTNPIIPPFRLLRIDSATYLTKDDIRKNHKTIVMFFSPDCDHCKHQTDSFMANLDKFKDVQFVMATYQPFGEMKEFYQHYHLADHANFYIGRDEKFFLVPFYRIHNLPYLALYDKKGNLITTFEGTQKINNILKAFQGK